jgi:exosortase
MESRTERLNNPRAVSSEDSWVAWGQFLTLLAIVCFLYQRIVPGMVRQWWGDPEYNYCFFVPILSAIVVWRKRTALNRIAGQPSWSGLLVIGGALGLLLLGTLGAENFLARSSFLFLVAGLAIYFQGWEVFQVLLFPWLALFLMIPLPAIIFNQISLPLQFFASSFGAWLLSLTGIPVVREGNVINLPSITLDVAEACSGLRSLSSLLTVAIFYGYFFEENGKRRFLLAASAVPIAIVANGVRIMCSGVVGQRWGAEWAEGFYHLGSGVLIFLFSFLALILLRRFFVWCAEAVSPKVKACDNSPLGRGF